MRFKKAKAHCFYCGTLNESEAYPVSCRCGAELSKRLTGQETPEELAELERKAFGPNGRPLEFYLAS
jgi:hypothetical protein